MDSHGYCFQVDMALRVIDAGHTVLEVPIVFSEREIGESKMSRAIVLEAMWKVTLWGATRHARKLRSMLPHRSKTLGCLGAEASMFPARSSASTPGARTVIRTRKREWCDECR